MVAFLISCNHTPQINYSSIQKNLQFVDDEKENSVVESNVFSKTISLNGQWQFKPGNFSTASEYLSKTSIDSWTNISVPHNWFLAGYDISGVAWYRKQFDLSKETLGKTLMLNFEGVDYMADVWLNGHHLGFHTGYFQAFSFDISHFVKANNNELIVRVNSPLEQPGQSWSLHKRLIKGVFGHHDARPGGAWSERGQEKNTGGIWAPVFIKVSQKLSIENVLFFPELDEDNQTSKGLITLNIKRQKLSANQLKHIKVILTLSPDNFSGNIENISQSFSLAGDQNSIELKIPDKKRPLWWPWEMGKPNLYRATIRIMQDGELLDSWQKLVGFRSVRVESSQGEWFINGNRIFIRGTNYIATQWLSEMDSDAYAKDIELMKSAHINMVRVHAHILSKDFYSQADQKGMLVWQDFPLQWGYIDTEDFIQECERQAKDMVQQFYNFPSIVAWSGHNEPPWDASWMTSKYSDYEPEQNRVLDKRVFETITRLDSSRYAHKHSSTREHPWLGWYSGRWQDYAKPTQEPLITEYGAQALPEILALTRIVGKENLWPETKSQLRRWKYHNFQPKETFEIAGVPKGETTQELIDNTQHYQARLIKYAAENYRRQRYQPVGGIFQFMFVENWPSMNWGILDYWRQPKEGYYALQTAYQPILPSIEWAQESYTLNETIKFSLWAINDLDKTIQEGSFNYSLFYGEEIVEKIKYSLTLSGDNLKKIASITKSLKESGKYKVAVSINDNDGTELGRNYYHFTVLPTVSQK